MRRRRTEKPPVIGRPTLPPDQVKSAVVSARVTPSVAAELDRMADRGEFRNRSDFLADVLTRLVDRAKKKARRARRAS